MQHHEITENIYSLSQFEIREVRSFKSYWGQLVTTTKRITIQDFYKSDEHRLNRCIHKDLTKLEFIVHRNSSSRFLGTKHARATKYLVPSPDINI